jgi:hypothetical protein
LSTWTVRPSNGGKIKVYQGESPSAPGTWQLALASDVALIWDNDDDLYNETAGDLRARRSGGNTLTIDDGAGGAAALIVIGNVTATGGVMTATAHALASGAFWTEYAGSPENNVVANKGSMCSDNTTGEVYRKTTNGVATGWKLMRDA